MTDMFTEFDTEIKMRFEDLKKIMGLIDLEEHFHSLYILTLHLLTTDFFKRTKTFFRDKDIEDSELNRIRILCLLSESLNKVKSSLDVAIKFKDETKPSKESV